MLVLYFLYLFQALEKMKKYEERLAAKKEKMKSAGETYRTDMGDVSSSAMDQGDESSVNSDSVPVRADL